MPLSWMPSTAEAGDTISLDPEESHHIQHVLRHQRGDTLKLTDGLGTLYTAKIQSITRKSLEVYIETKEVQSPPKIKLTLAAALLKGEKTDGVIQKATELGVGVYQPLLTQHTLVKKEIALGKRERWQKISHEASKQCERTHAMIVAAPMTLRDFAVQEADLKVFFWEKSKNTAKKIFREQNFENLHTLSVIIGPEGGFTDDEAKVIINAGYTDLSLGSHILKADTAALAAVTIVLHEVTS